MAGKRKKKANRRGRRMTASMANYYTPFNQYIYHNLTKANNTAQATGEMSLLLTIILGTLLAITIGILIYTWIKINREIDEE